MLLLAFTLLRGRYEVIDTPTDIFVVMEYCSDGELFDMIVEKGRVRVSASAATHKTMGSFYTDPAKTCTRGVDMWT